MYILKFIIPCYRGEAHGHRSRSLDPVRGLVGDCDWFLGFPPKVIVLIPLVLKCPCNVHRNTHAKKSIHLKIRMTSMVLGYEMDSPFSPFPSLPPFFLLMDNSTWIRNSINKMDHY